MSAAVVAHCDWSMEQKRRWMAVAIKRGGHWHVQPPELVGDTSSLLDRLQRRAVDPGGASHRLRWGHREWLAGANQPSVARSQAR
ncbi:MAG: hypothetical protein AAAB20_28165 [Rhizobium sp.]|uniref:hypothetical protein n=1 Tax=Rhizobium sp. TaxID=391 RepID=UPI0030F07E63